MRVRPRMIEIGESVEHGDAAGGQTALEVEKKVARRQIIRHAVAVEQIDDHHRVAAVARAQEGARVGLMRVHFAAVKAEHFGCRT